MSLARLSSPPSCVAGRFASQLHWVYLALVQTLRCVLKDARRRFRVLRDPETIYMRYDSRSRMLKDVKEGLLSVGQQARREKTSRKCRSGLPWLLHVLKAIQSHLPGP